MKTNPHFSRRRGVQPRPGDHCGCRPHRLPRTRERNERHREETRVPLKTLAGLSKARTYVGCSFTSSMRLPVTRAMPTQHENSSMGPPGSERSAYHAPDGMVKCRRFVPAFDAVSDRERNRQGERARSRRSACPSFEASRRSVRQFVWDFQLPNSRGHG